MSAFLSIYMWTPHFMTLSDHEQLYSVKDSDKFNQYKIPRIRIGGRYNWEKVGEIMQDISVLTATRAVLTTS